MAIATKVALVTGANKGIGFETARQLAKQGFHVLIGARDENRGNEAATKLKGEGLSAEFVKLDVTSDADRKAVAQHIAEHHGNALDVLVNNAAIAIDGEHKSSTVPLDVLRQTFDANFFSVIALTQALLPSIHKSEAGRIVNLSSGLASLGLHSDPSWSFYNYKPLAYDASKTAINAFTVHLAHELKDTPIKVNAADPGWVKTDMGGDGAALEVTEGAKTSLWLATLGADGPTGGFFHMQERHPW
ncbi:MAG: SDR family oxidoreductase [Planctomycetota bacterium]|nr:SDR family oxidoreductase [Planctomycetota bacterium]